MAAGVSQFPKPFFGDLACVFSDTVVAENNNEFFITYPGDDTPGDGIDPHEKIGNYHTNIRINHVAQMDVNLALSLPHILQGEFKIF